MTIYIDNYSVLSKKNINLNIDYSFPSDYCLIDLETTGLDANYDEIIQVAALKVRNDEITDKFVSFVKPNNQIDEFITELTGITNEDLENAPKILDIVDNLFDFIGDDILMGHNFRFDARFLNNIDESHTITNRSYIDTMYIARKVRKNLNHHRLEDLANYYNVDYNDAHNAYIDCIITKHVYEYLRNDSVGIDFKRGTHNFDAKELSYENITPDEDSLFFNKYVCFTGVLEKMTRKEAGQLVINIGGFVDNNVTKKTNYLVLGNNDYCKAIKDGKSNKHKKAIKLKSEGQDIEVVPESLFYEMISY